VKYIIGSFWGVVISLFYSFALPAGERFPGAGGGACPGVSAGRVASGAPAHHVYGDGDHPDAAHSVRAGAHYSGDFAVAANTAIALFAATGFAVISMSLLQTVQADGAITRLLNLCQRDIRRSVKGTLRVDETHWINLMMDRTALLLPRLQRARRSRRSIGCYTRCVWGCRSCIYAAVTHRPAGRLTRFFIG
jgi:hypothetical protein